MGRRERAGRVRHDRRHRAASAKRRRPYVDRPCRTDECSGRVDARRHYIYCTKCRYERRKQEFAAKCLTPWCDGRFIVKAKSLQDVRDSPTKFCPKCRGELHGRIKALQLQVEEGRPIHDVIVHAGRAAFDADTTGRHDVIGRFSKSLGIRYEILHEWLKVFFGLSWPDWKRRYICASQSCSVVDVSRVRTSRDYKQGKYYPIEKLRKRGTCSCPILGDDLILINKRPQELTPPALTNLFQRELPWFGLMTIVSGSHLPLLPRQENR